ncbi:carboxypeptidase-like regulatory domain-containing protein [Niabella soli]|uniref:carboxypeptidase-like regulatory domain-containing protein n=1 Tax=Niabella soli TaxID=446683 RepID=UPI0002499623|nr:carboxypeptidase-like regulatory domain-containing protein [Niabella soli]
MVKKLVVVFIIAVFLLPSTAHAQFEKARDSVIQLFGIIMTSDSLYGVPSVSVTVKGTNRGTISNGDGVFSIAALKGDVIEFSHVSYKPLVKQIPKDLKGDQYNMVVLLTGDTSYLPAVIIRPRPTPEQFARDFVNVKVAEDEMEILRKNNTKEMQRKLVRRTPFDGREASNQQLNMISQKARYQGQLPPMNIFNPAAWSEFIKAWKRGDFKNNN